MSGLIYFFPRLTADGLARDNRLVPEALARYGLASSLADLGEVDRWASLFFIASAGPGGSSGTLLTILNSGGSPPRLGYHPPFQTWQTVRSDPELWIGFDREYPPGPEDLARPQRVPGHWVQLGDGNRYLVPVARSESRWSLLPADIYHGPDGQAVMAIQAAYASIWEASAEVWDALYSDAGPPSWPWEKILDQCLRFLGVNYRIGPHENAALRLVGTGQPTGRPVWTEILRAAVDVPFMEEMLAAQKKNREHTPAGTLSSAPPPPAESPTASAAPSCS